ncbi:MAG: FAD-dependent oxidoreductase [Parachlamydiaceae bacterium]
MAFFRLPSPADVHQPQIVVIGAGLAGLTTAYRLYNAGMDVGVYEARPRIGGRIFTLDFNGDEVELGAQTFRDNGQHVYLLKLIDELGLEVVTQRVNSHEAYFENGVSTPLRYLTNVEIDPLLLRNQAKEMKDKQLSLKD